MKLTPTSLFLLSLTALCFSMCSKKERNGGSPIVSESSTVYCAGYERISNGRPVAKIWENGKAYNLTDGTKEGKANAVFVRDTNVYVAGYEVNASGVSVAKVWINGLSVSLTEGTNNAEAKSVFATGTDVYVAGYENSIIGPLAMLWKNGVGKVLVSNGSISEAKSVSVVGTDVYVGGYESFGSNISFGVIWKNGIMTQLSDGLYSTEMNALHVSGIDIYVGGKEDALFIPDNKKPKIWKVGKLLTGYTNYTRFITKSIFVEKNDIYIAGQYQDNYQNAILWKNDAMTVLAIDRKDLWSPRVEVEANSVFVIGADVYVGGRSGKAMLWKNGVSAGLETTSNEGSVLSVYIK